MIEDIDFGLAKTLAAAGGQHQAIGVLLNDLSQRSIQVIIAQPLGHHKAAGQIEHHHLHLSLLQQLQGQGGIVCPI